MATLDAGITLKGVFMSDGVAKAFLVTAQNPLGVWVQVSGQIDGWRVAAVHALIVTLGIAIAAQFASLLVQDVPFTRAYPPGHAKLKTRWQLYLLGMWAIAYVPVRMELAVLNDAWGLCALLAKGVVVLAVLEVAGRRRARKWTLPPEPELDDDPEAPTWALYYFLSSLVSELVDSLAADL